MNQELIELRDRNSNSIIQQSKYLEKIEKCETKIQEQKNTIDLIMADVQVLALEKQ